MLHRVGWLDWLFVALSKAGTLGLLWVALAIGLAILRRSPSIVLLVLATTGAANLLAYGLKRLIDVDRPPIRYHSPEPLVRVPLDHSFPSGHAATSFAAALVLSRASPAHAPLFFVLAAAVAFSRVYVGVHYPFDVTGGAIVGLVVATVLLRLVRARRRSPPAPPAG